MSVVYIVLGVFGLQWVAYGFHCFAPPPFLSRRVHPIIVTIYVVFFIFFRLGTYSSEQAQIAGSTKPLTAQRRRFLHRYYRYYRFHSRYHQPLVYRYHMHGPSQIYQRADTPYT